MAATLSRRGPAPRARRSLLGLLAFVALGAAGCPNPASKFDEYLDRVPKRDMTIVDMALPPSKIFDVTGASLLSLSTVIEPTKPILFYTEAKLAPQQDGTGLLDLKLQPLHYMTHVVVGTPIEVKAVKVKDTGSFEAVLGSQTVVGDANPITGRDISATLTLRGVIRPAEPIMYIVPADAPLIVRGHVQPTSIDQVQIGQQAVLRFSAFDARTTPEISGHVQALSADAIEDKARGTRYYNVDIQIDAGGREKLVGRKLLPGMPVEAFIGTDERSPLSYFVKPFTDYFSRAFQEG